MQETVIPNTKFLLFKAFGKTATVFYHLECKNCLKYGIRITIGEKSGRCVNCNILFETKDHKVLFSTFSLRDVLQTLVAKHENSLVFPTDASLFPMNDVFCGSLFRNATLSHGKFLAIGVNTDGLKKFNKTKDSIWPLFMCLYNIPKALRLRRENLATLALFNGRNIDMEAFVGNFVKEIDEINSEGGLLTKYGQLKVFCITASLDSVARPKLQNHKQFNGFFGCSSCFNKGKTIKGSSVVKYPFR